MELFAESVFFSEAGPIASNNSLNLVSTRPTDKIYLEYKDTLCLVDGQTKESIVVDFLAGKNRHRRQSGGGEILLKALGLSTNLPLTVTDATAGLGRDAFVIANSGSSVTLLEQSPVLHLLLEQAIKIGLQQGSEQEQEILNKMFLASGNINAIDYFANNSADVVYIDPMFPLRKKSALVKKEMRILQKLLPHVDTDETQAKALFNAAFNAAIYRVIVKRPLKASLLCKNPSPAFQLKGKSIRFDVYTKVALPKTTKRK